MLESYQTLEVRRQALLKSIVQIGPFLMATPTWLKVRCGNPRCECATDREKRHEKLHLNWSEAGGKHGTLYVPIDLREEVLKWTERYWVLKQRIQEMNELSQRMIRLYVKSKKRKKS